MIMGIEFAYAAETAFVSPLLLGIGLDHSVMTMFWALSPLLGFFISPILGSISDRCRSSMGRRRPLLLVLSIGLIAGLILAPYGKYIGHKLGDRPDANVTSKIVFIVDNVTSSQQQKFSYTTPPLDEADSGYYWAIVFTVLGTVLLDFNADNCQTPARAYLLDCIVQEDQGKALAIFTLMAGSGMRLQLKVEYPILKLYSNFRWFFRLRIRGDKLGSDNLC